MRMRTLALLLAAALLAGCTRGVPPPAPGQGQDDGPAPTSGGPVSTPAGPCLALSLEPRPAVFAVGQRVGMLATVVNCGSEEFALLTPTHCTLGRSLAVGIEGNDGRTYWLTRSGEPPLDDELLRTMRGPCGVRDLTEVVLPPGARHSKELSWNGTVGRAHREVEETSQGTGVRTTTVPTKLTPGQHRVFLHLHAPEGTRESWSNRSVYVAPTRDNPDPHVAPRPGLSLWLSTPPPADPPQRPADLHEASARNEPTDPREVPAHVLEAGRGLLRGWTGPFAENYTLSRVVRQSMEAFCLNGFDRCDRWGWTDYYLLDYEVRFPVEGNASFTLMFPVRSDGVVLDEDVWGVPECVRDPRECVVTVGADEALRRAREEGLGNGTRPWRAEFVWHREQDWPVVRPMGDEGVPPRVQGSWAWQVRNATDEHDSGGDLVVIDANDGRLLQRDRWARFYVR